jgi:hypothetical protein
MSVRSEQVIPPLPQNQSATGIGHYGFCWGLVEDLEIKTAGEASSANQRKKEHKKLMFYDLGSKNSQHL